MINKIILPRFDTNMLEATLVHWLVKEGDQIEKDQQIVEVITDKAEFTFESPEVGTLLKIIAEEKSVIPPGFIIAILGEEGDEVPDVSIENQKVEQALKEETEASFTLEKSEKKAVDKTGSFRASPAAKRLAKEKGLDLSKIFEHCGCERIKENHIEEYLKSLS